MQIRGEHPQTDRSDVDRPEGLIAGVLGLGALLVLNRGDSKQAGLGPASKHLQGAVYAGAIPVIKGARFEDTMGGNYYDAIGGPVTFSSQSWFFKVDVPPAQVAEFYRSNLPPGARAVEAEPGDFAFEWVPPGAKEGEEVVVRISEEDLQITEVVKAPGT